MVEQDGPRYDEVVEKEYEDSETTFVDKAVTAVVLVFLGLFILFMFTAILVNSVKSTSELLQ